MKKQNWKKSIKKNIKKLESSRLTHISTNSRLEIWNRDNLIKKQKNSRSSRSNNLMLNDEIKKKLILIKNKKKTKQVTIKQEENS